MKRRSIKFEVISANFTRVESFTYIQSSSKIDYKTALQILNQFIPQGSSPKYNIRISSFEYKIGIGYYYMTNRENSSISIIFVQYGKIENIPLNIPLTEVATRELSQNNFRKFLEFEKLDAIKLSDYFSSEDIGLILYSLLAGDNIIIVHHNYNERIQFFKSVTQIIPAIWYHYNTINTNCNQ